MQHISSFVLPLCNLSWLQVWLMKNLTKIIHTRICAVFVVLVCFGDEIWSIYYGCWDQLRIIILLTLTRPSSQMEMHQPSHLNKCNWSKNLTWGCLIFKFNHWGLPSVTPPSNYYRKIVDTQLIKQMQLKQEPYLGMLVLSQKAHAGHA